ncbi:MAG: RHS repeat-associated core domain-containing protein [Chloroflexota bacterium]|nr:RHS repeat-associated core domain-containing protein [Chloroflexota bacterium]
MKAPPGGVIWHRTFGEILGHSITRSAPFKYALLSRACQCNEAGIGLMDYNARFYDAALGRFISADTIVPNAANPQDLNRYAYVRNSPLNYRDPSGHAADSGDVRGIPWPPPPPPQGLGRGPLYPGAEDDALALNVVGAIAEAGAFGASVIGAGVQDSIWFLGAASDGGLPIGDVAGLAAGVTVYKMYFDKIENAAGLASFATTSLADNLAGYTYLDLADTPSGYIELVLGQDTSTDLLLSGIGTLWPEGNVDVVLNGIQMVNSYKSILQEPTWEVRIVFPYGDYDGQYSYIRGYDDNGWYTVTDVFQGKIYDNRD